MSAFIGNLKGPNHNSPNDVAEVWCSPHVVELNLIMVGPEPITTLRRLDPIAARNLAALLVRASEEAERMALPTGRDRLTGETTRKEPP